MELLLKLLICQLSYLGAIWECARVFLQLSQNLREIIVAPTSLAPP